MLIALFLMFHSFGQTHLVDRTEAFVNKNLILSSDITQFRKTLPLRTQLDPMFNGSSLSARGSAATRSEIVQFLIDEALISQNFPATDSEVEQEINTIQSANRINRSSLKATLKEQGFDFSDYYDLIKVSLSKKNLIDREIRSKVFISDDDVKNYFLNHYLPKTGSAGYSYRLQIIRVNMKNFKQPAAAKEVLMRAMQAVKAGESFAEVAKRFSDDPTGTSGGEVGTFTKEDLTSQIYEQIKNLKIGETTDILEEKDRSSYFFFRLADLKTGHEDQLAKMKEEIRGQLMLGEFQHQIQLWIQRQRSNSYIHLADEKEEYKK